MKIVLSNITTGETVIMNVSIEFGVNANKYFQTKFRNDYYATFNRKERDELKAYTASQKFRDTIKCYISNHGHYHGEATIDTVKVVDKDDKLRIHVDATFTNPDNYSVKRLRDIIDETVWHYYPSGSAGEYHQVYYTVKDLRCEEQAEIEDKDVPEDQVCVVEKAEKKRAKVKVRSGWYQFNIYICNIFTE